MGLSGVKVTGQALAAVTTAGIGAYLGGAVGTVSGAAIASVVTTIGDAFYQRSLERTRDGIKRLRRTPDAATAEPEARTRVVPSTSGAAPTTVAPLGAPGRPPEPDETPTRVLPELGGPATGVAPTEQATRVGPTEQATRVVPTERGTRRVDGPVGPDGPVGSEAPTALAEAPTALAETPAASRPSPWRRYGVLAATGLLVFLVAMVAITGIERVKGSPLSGGGPGTSVGSVLGHPTPVQPSTGASASDDPSTTAEAPAPTTTSGAERPAPTTTAARAPERERATTTTRERSGGGLIPTGLLPDR